MNKEAEFIHSRLMAMPETIEWTPQKSDWAFLVIAGDEDLKRLALKYWVCDFQFASKYLNNIDTAIREKFELGLELAY